MSEEIQCPSCGATIVVSAEQTTGGSVDPHVEVQDFVKAKTNGKGGTSNA